MFYSQTLLSKKGPFGAIRVAAYFFKRLKKPHVQLTDIASSVDTILQEEFPLLTYRVLGYLLLGIVRIYSKKVEYLLDDCQEVLIGVKNFVVHTKEDFPVDPQRAPYFSITLPESFELDAFDLEIHGVDDTIGGNVLPDEEITLKDNTPENGGAKQYASDICFGEEIPGSHGTCSANYFPVEGVVSSYWMDVHLRNTISIDSLIASMENLPEYKSQKECLNIGIISSVEKESQNADRLYDENNQNNREKIEDPQMLLSKDGLRGAVSTEKLQDSGEKGVNLVRSSEIEGGPADHAQPDGEDIQSNPQHLMVLESEQRENEMCVQMLSSKDGIREAVSSEKPQDCSVNGVNLVRSLEIKGGLSDNVQRDGEDIQINTQRIRVSESEQLENEMCEVTRQDHNLINLQAETEKLRDNMCSQVEAMDIVMFEHKEPREHVKPFDEENHDDGEQRLPEMPENIKSHVLGGEDLLSIELDRTPEIKVPDASGASTLQFMSIPTPVTKERSLANARASAPKFISIRTPATKERARIARKRKCVFDDIVVLPNKVLKESIQDASDLVSKRRKVAHTVLAVWRASRTFHNEFFEPLFPCFSSELRSLFSGKKLKIKTTVRTVEPPKELDIPEIPIIAISELKSIAPETPIQRSRKSFESRVSPQTPNYDRVRPELFENVEQAPAPIRELDPAPIRDKEPIPIKDQELDLSPSDEVINSCVKDDNELDGWTGRTRKVARYLHRSFLDQKERGEEEVVNVLQVAKGRTKKESARFFYEILVLSSKGYVDVKQNDGYGDILVQKLQSPNMEPNLWRSL